MSTFGQPAPVLSEARPAVAVPRTAPWLAAGAGAVVLVVAAGWFGLVAPQRTAASDLRASTAQVEANEQALAARVTQLKQEFAALPEHQAKLAALEEQLPADAALPDLVRGLRDVAARSGVQLTSLTPSAPAALGGAATSVAQPAPAAAETGASAADATAGAATTAGASSSGSAQAGSGLLEVPVTLTASGSYSSLMVFLAGVQQERRLMLVKGTTVTTGTQEVGQGGLVLTVTGSVFVLPASTADTATSPGSTSQSTTTQSTTTQLPAGATAGTSTN